MQSWFWEWKPEKRLEPKAEVDSPTLSQAAVQAIQHLEKKDIHT